VFPGNGYNIIRAALLEKPGWKEVRKEDVWKLMGTKS